MLNYEQYITLIVRPTLEKLHMYSPQAEQLLAFTCSTESIGGTYLKQIGGVALGIYQMEPTTYNDIWQRYLRFRPNLVQIMALQFNAPHMQDEDRMIYDFEYATAMARLHYLRVPEKLPAQDDLEAIWIYYKKYWNTDLGKATKDKSMVHYVNFKSQK